MRGIERLPSMDPEESEMIRQFENPEKMLLNSEEVEVVDISPPPEKLKNNTPVLYLPGFSATPEALRSTILQTAKAGRRVISANAPHGVEAKSWYYKSVLGLESDNPGLPESESRKTMLLQEIIKKKKLEKVSVIAHSEAAIWATAEASAHPEKFSDVVYVEPAGLSGKDTPFGLFKGMIEDQKESARLDKEEAEREKFLKEQGASGYEKREKAKYVSMTAGLKSTLPHPIYSIREMRAIANADIEPGLRKMHESGVGIAIVHAENDKIFDAEKVKNIVDKNIIDDFRLIKGTHGDVYTKELYARMPEVELSLLERKREERERDNKARLRAASS